RFGGGDVVVELQPDAQDVETRGGAGVEAATGGDAAAQEQGVDHSVVAALQVCVAGGEGGQGDRRGGVSAVSAGHRGRDRLLRDHWGRILDRGEDQRDREPVAVHVVRSWRRVGRAAPAGVI